MKQLKGLLENVLTTVKDKNVHSSAKVLLSQVREELY